MTKFDKIKQIIKAYHETADRRYSDYKEKEKKAREKYSPEGFKTEFQRKTWVEMAGATWADADDAIRELNDIFNEIESDFNSWLMHPLDANTLQILNCVGDFGLKLSVDELRIIEKNVRGSYFGTKIFVGLAEKNGFKVKVPEMREFLNELNSARDNSEFAIRAYGGKAPDFLGADLLPEWKYRGVKMGSYQSYHLFMAANFLKDGGQIDRLQQMWDSCSAPMHYVLTDSETEKVKKDLEKIVDVNGEIDREKAMELIEKQPDIKSKLESLPQGSFENMETVLKYFGLNSTEEKNHESKISPSMENVLKYAPSLGKVNMDILNQY